MHRQREPGNLLRMVFFEGASWKPLMYFLLGVVVATGLIIVAFQEFDSRAGDEGGASPPGQADVTGKVIDINRNPYGSDVPGSNVPNTKVLVEFDQEHIELGDDAWLYVLSVERDGQPAEGTSLAAGQHVAVWLDLSDIAESNPPETFATRIVIERD